MGERGLTAGEREPRTAMDAWLSLADQEPLRFIPGPDFTEEDLCDESLPSPQGFELRYHVPKNQCYPGSRGATIGHLHTHVTEQFDFGRIHRKPGQALCGRRGWWERAPEDGDSVTCPRCDAIYERYCRREAVSRG